TPASARSRRQKAHEEVSSPKNRPHRRMEISAYPSPSCSDLTPQCTVARITAAAPSPLRPGLADHVQGRPVPRRGWKWWTCGNGGMLDFHETAESHFQSNCWKWKKRRKNRDFQISTAIFAAMLANPKGEHHQRRQSSSNEVPVVAARPVKPA